MSWVKEIKPLIPSDGEAEIVLWAHPRWVITYRRPWNNELLVYSKKKMRCYGVLLTRDHIYSSDDGTGYVVGFIWKTPRHIRKKIWYFFKIQRLL